MSGIVGIDEVGRGCWAGPVVAGAVLLDEPIIGLKDSKLLTKARREAFASLIHEKAVAVGVGWVSPADVDKLGLTVAVALAMRRALAKVTGDYDEIIIDGSYNFLPGNPKVTTLVKADSLVPAVSAASIIAKVARDKYMAEAGKTYPQYQFEKHVGYGTALHHEMLKRHGVCALHRLSYKPVKELVT